MIYNRQENTSNVINIPVLLKYTIKQNKTGIDIEHLSMIRDEEEVLILPFSVFKIKNRIENCSSMLLPMLVEIDLEEYEDNQKEKSKFNQ